VILDFTEHALERMASHAVSAEEVFLVVEHGRTCRAHPGRSCRQLRFRRTVVTVIYEGRPRSGVLVITVWRSPR